MIRHLLYVQMNVIDPSILGLEKPESFQSEVSITPYRVIDTIRPVLDHLDSISKDAEHTRKMVMV